MITNFVKEININVCNKGRLKFPDCLYSDYHGPEMFKVPSIQARDILPNADNKTTTRYLLLGMHHEEYWLTTLEYTGYCSISGRMSSYFRMFTVKNRLSSTMRLGFETEVQVCEAHFSRL